MTVPSIPGGVVAILFVLGLAGCTDEAPRAVAAEKKPAGAVCRISQDCHVGLACADRVCVRAPREDGESCGMHAACAAGLVCHRSATVDRNTFRDPGYGPSDSYGDRCRRPEQAAADKERKLLEESGLSSEEVADSLKPAAEAPRLAAGPGLRVRVVRTESTIGDERGKVFAACRKSERLISGSCGLAQGSRGVRSRLADLESGVAGYSETDTVGARWVCVGARGDQVVVKALCQALAQ